MLGHRASSGLHAEVVTGRSRHGAIANNPKALSQEPSQAPFSGASSALLHKANDPSRHCRFGVLLGLSGSVTGAKTRGASGSSPDQHYGRRKAKRVSEKRNRSWKFVVYKENRAPRTGGDSDAGNPDSPGAAPERRDDLRRDARPALCGTPSAPCTCLMERSC